MTGHQGYAPPPVKRTKRMNYADLGASWGRQFTVGDDGRIDGGSVSKEELILAAASLTAQRVEKVCRFADHILSEVRSLRKAVAAPPAPAAPSETEVAARAKRLTVQRARLRAMRAYLKAGGVDDCHYMRWVEDAPFPGRAARFLLDNRYDRVGDVCAATRLDLALAPGGSFAVADEVASGLALLGLNLEGQPEPETPAGDPTVLTKPVSDLHLCVRARKCLNRLNITTVGELCRRTADDLLRARNFGESSLADVRGRLREYGLRLAGEPA